MKKKIIISILSFILLFSLGESKLSAQAPGGGNTPPPGGGNSDVTFSFPNPFKGGDSLFALLRSILNDIVLPIGGVLAVLAFIYSGFLYVTAQGDTKKIQDAHRALLYTSIGTAVLLGSWLLASVICNTIGQLGGPICPT